MMCILGKRPYYPAPSTSTRLPPTRSSFDAIHVMLTYLLQSTMPRAGLARGLLNAREELTRLE